MEKNINIVGRKIGSGQPVFIIAEVSSNHGQNFNHAKTLIKRAKESGADAVKFQIYTPDSITVNVNNKFFQIKHPKWGGQTLYHLYKKAYTPWSWFKRLKKFADNLGITFFASAFDKTSVDFLEELKVPLHKVSSFELVDLPLIEYMAKTGKPLIISTGMATIFEIKEAVAAARRAGAKDIILLKCVSNYPAKAEEMNLKALDSMRKIFNCQVGLSDHTLDIGVSVAAVSLGAVVIEKHITISRKIKTPDNFFSLEPDEFGSLVYNARLAQAALGKSTLKLTTIQRRNRILRRSLFVVKNIKKGELFTGENIKSVRPSHGLHPRHLKTLLGKTSARKIIKGTPLKFTLIKKEKHL